MQKMNSCIENKSKAWTKAGLTELGKIIRFNREARKLTLRVAAEKITQLTGQSIKFTTLGDIERGVVMPEFNTLDAIAASRLVLDRNNKPLTIYDFIDIASESIPEKACEPRSGVIKGITDMCINVKIAIAIRFYGISQDDLEAAFLNRKSSATLSVERLRKIQETGEAAIGEKRIIYMVLDGREQLFSRDEWLGNCNSSIENLDDAICNGKP
jgi:transcriptional regulator with XRE-family HTH domain